MSMAQVASAFPTAGALYHWSSILGGRGWGWLTAWLNIFGLVTVLVPDEMNVNNNCQMEFGDAKCLPEGAVDGGTDGTDGAVLNLNIDGRFGSVEVHRG